MSALNPLALAALLLTRIAVAASTPVEGAAVAAAEGESLIQAGDYGGAAAAYARAVEAGADSPDMLYNLGTAALKAGQIGEAVLALERAQRRTPLDGDIAFNLERALERVGGELGPAARAPRPLAPLLRLRGDQWQGLALALFACALVAVALRLALRQRGGVARVGLGFGALLLWLAGAVAVVGAAGRAHVESRGDAVIVANTTVIAREAPGDSAPTLFALEAGHRVQVIERRDPFARIRLINGLEGWIEGGVALPVEEAHR